MNLIKLKTVNKILDVLNEDTTDKIFEYLDEYKHNFNKVINELKNGNDKYDLQDMYNHLQSSYRKSKDVMSDVFDIIFVYFNKVSRNVLDKYYLKVLQIYIAHNHKHGSYISYVLDTVFND